MLLSLALVGGNAQADLHLGAAPHQPCPEALDHHAGSDSPQHEHRKAADPACCCDCLGGVSAVNPMPDLTSFLPAFPTGTARYGAASPVLAGRALLPEPESCTLPMIC